MDSIKDLVRQSLRIEDIIGSYVPLVPFGKNYKARCPFHQEKTPSFNITTDKQMFYCFGCKKGGDIFSFVQEIEHVDFKEALKLLADKAGIDVRHSAELSAEVRKKKTLFDIHEYATRFFQLLLAQNPAVMDYLHTRGITTETIKQWRIGYAPDGYHHLVTVLQKKGFSAQDLIDSGLVIKGDRGMFDRFHGRIMFPITDTSGKVIAFSGRLFPGSKESEREHVGKYVNSPETALYHKSVALFGFSHAKSAITQKKSVIVTEGQFDTILLHQFGDTNTVALSGTACTNDHIQQLARFASELIIATDADHAGIQSAHHIAKLGYAHDCDISLITLPAGKDPAQVIQEDSSLWEQYKSNKKDYITFFSESTQQQPLRERIVSLTTHLFPVIAGITNHMYRDGKLRFIAEAFHVSESSMRTEFEKYLFGQKTQTAIPETMEKKPHDPLSVQIQELTLIHELFWEETGFWFTGNPEATALVAENQNLLSPEYRAEQSTRYQSLDSVAWKIRLDTLWIRIQQLSIERSMELIRAQIRAENNESTEELQQELLHLKNRREQLVQSLAE